MLDKASRRWISPDRLQQLHDQVRGLVPWPSASMVLAGKPVKVHRTAVGGETSAPAGSVVEADKNGLALPAATAGCCVFLNCRARAASAWQRRIICGAIRSRWPVTPRDARDAALEALLQMERRGAWSDGSLKRIAAQSGLEARDAALCTRMTYGVVQNRTLLDYYIDHWCTQKAARLEPVVACLLRLGIYQILFMDKVPDRAAVHETVELTKRRGKARAAGMINAVLRKCASSKNTLPQLPQNSFISKAAVQYSHPRWLVERLTALVGEQEAEAFLRLDNEPVPTVIQANPLKTTPAELENELRSDGVRLVPHPWLEGCFEVTGTGDLERLSAFASGRCTVQDARRVWRPLPPDRSPATGAGCVRRPWRQILRHGHADGEPGRYPLL